MKTSKQNYIIGLDGLRALAVIMVIGYHLRIPAFQGGVLGVTIFFVLSGFLITRLLLQELKTTQTINLKQFWVKRIRRIWPPLILVVSLTVLVSVFVDSILYNKAIRDFWSALGGFNNWYQIFNNISYFENSGAPSPLLHCWSLAIETQFYLVFPILLLLLSKIKQFNQKKMTILVTLSLTIISLVTMMVLYVPGTDPTRVYYGLDTRAFSLLIGALLAMITSYLPRLSFQKYVNNTIGIVSLAIIFWMVYAIPGYDDMLYYGGYGLVSLLTGIVIFTILKKKSLLARFLALKPIDWIGKLSYSLYLWHYPIIILISGGKQSSWLVMIIEVVLTFVMATLSYYLVETPIRHRIISRSFQAIRSHTWNQQKIKKQMIMLATCFVLFISSVFCVTFIERENVADEIEQTVDESKKEQPVDKTEDEQEEEAPEQQTVTVNYKAMTDDEIMNNLNILMIGDSVLEGAWATIAETYPHVTVDAARSRQASTAVSLLQTDIANGWQGNVLVYSLGTNGTLGTSLEETYAALPENVTMFVITLRDPYSAWINNNNAIIKEFCASHDNVFLIDWQAYSEGHGDWFYKDETHLNGSGRIAYANCVKETLIDVFRNQIK